MDSRLASRATWWVGFPELVAAGVGCKFYLCICSDHYLLVYSVSHSDLNRNHCAAEDVSSELVIC